MKKAKVLMVHNFYQIGGGEHTVFENEKKLLKDNGHEVIEYTRHNNEIKGLKGKLLIPFISIFNFRTYFEIKQIIKNENINVMHCHNTFPIISPSVYYAAKKLEIPVVQTIHNFRLMCLNGIFYTDGKICEECVNKSLKCGIRNGCYRDSKLGSLVVATMLKVHRMLNTFNRKVDRYIALTDFNKRKLSDIIDNNKITVKPNFSYVSLENDNTIKCKEYFIFVGRLDRAKGIKFLLNSWSKIKDHKLLVLGDGPLRGYVEEVSLNNSNIDYLGSKNHSEVIELIKNAKAFIFTSEWYEGFPMVILEAMSQGTAIITPNIGNSASIVENGKIGLHYKLHNTDDFIDKINEINYEELYKRYGENAKQYFNLRYNSTVNYQMLNNIYDEVREFEKR